LKNRFKFNLMKLRSLPPAASGSRDMYHDTKHHFLKCRVTDNGSKTLVISAKLNGRSVKKAVYRLRGEELDPTMETLRLQARDVFQKLEREAAGPGRGPVLTFGEMVDVWAESADMINATPSWRSSKLAVVRNHCAELVGRKLDDITRADVRRLITDLDRRGFAGVPRIVRSIVNQIFELAIDDGVLPEEHPIPIPRGLKLKRNKRDRRLSGEELSRLFHTLLKYKGHDRSDAASFRLMVLLALFTAQRRGNILQMRWDEIDNVNRIWTIPSSKAKTRREYRIPLVDIVWTLLQDQREHLLKAGQSGPWVFPSYEDPDKATVNIKRPWAWLLKHAKLDNFRFHDLRHSAASIAYEASQDLKGTQLFLQHADSRTTADRYIHTVDIRPQIRASGAVVTALIDAIGMDQDNFRDSILGAG